MTVSFPHDNLTQELLKIFKTHDTLPKKGIVAIVLRESPAWRKHVEHEDPRGAGNAIGRRLARMCGAGLVRKTETEWTR